MTTDLESIPMQHPHSRLGIVLLVLAAGSFIGVTGKSQATQAVPEQQAQQTGQGGAAASAPEVPKGVEVLARGPVHEAFASPTTEPAPTTAVPKEPPKPLEEMPPTEKPEGNVTW